MAKSMVQQSFGPLEVKHVDRPSERAERAVNKVDRLTNLPLEMAKARVGAAVDAAIGKGAAKTYGDKGLISKVVTGEKAPEYLARIYQDPQARRRFAVAWLADDEAVKVRTVIEIDEEVA